MPRPDPADQVEDVAVDQPSYGNLRAWGSDGSWRVHFNFVIHVPPEINTRFVTTFPTARGELLITVSPSINGSEFLVSFRDELVAQLHTTYSKIFWPYGYRQQQ